MSKSENKKSAPPKTPVASKADNATGRMKSTPRPKWWLNNKRYIQILPGLDTVEIWSEGEPNWIAQVYTEEHAELICRAVNNHEELLAALKTLIDTYIANPGTDKLGAAFDKARRAIVNAEKA